MFIVSLFWWGYFPIQNFPKIVPSISWSTSISPVIWPKYVNASRISIANKSPGSPTSIPCFIFPIWESVFWRASKWREFVTIVSSWEVPFNLIWWIKFSFKASILKWSFADISMWTISLNSCFIASEIADSLFVTSILFATLKMIFPLPCKSSNWLEIWLSEVIFASYNK